jgi:peptidoglycan/LPS O-acetylase OafA/YrhL
VNIALPSAWRLRPKNSNSPVNSDPHLSYRPEIDGLRAIAVLSVVLYHFSLGFPGGYVGVDVFFVISGYLITKIIYDLCVDKTFSFSGFYFRRIRRLFPALFVMLIVVTAWVTAHMIWIDSRLYGASLVAAVTYLSNIFFYLSSGYFAEAARTKPLLHTWSLGVEEQFYIFVPFLVLALERLLPKRWHVPVIVVFSIISFAGCVWLTRTATNAAFYLLPPRAWELGLGGAIAIWSPPVHRIRWLSEALCLGGIAAILYATLAFSDATPFPGWAAAIPTVGTAAILGTGGRSGSTVEQLLSTRPFSFVGKISYSLYLWHWPVIVAFTYGAVHPATWDRSLIAVATAFALAVFSWKYVEQPFRTGQLLRTPRSLFLTAAIASGATVGYGLILHHENGFAGRYSKSLVGILNPQILKKTTRPDCFSTSAQRAESGRLCGRGANTGAPTFVLAGDSHAAALGDGLFAAAASHGFSGVQFTSNGVVPLPGVTSLTSDVASKQALTRSFLVYMRRHPELRTVILAGFWSYRATGKSYRHQTVINVDAEYDGSGAAYNPTAFRHGLERLVEALPGRRFILLDDTPSGDKLSPDWYVRAVYSGFRPEPGLSRAEADEQRATYEPILEFVAERHRNVTYVPVLRQICGTRLCPLFSGGRPLFADGDHLTHFGSMQLENALGGIFEEMKDETPQFKGPLAPRQPAQRGQR